MVYGRAKTRNNIIAGTLKKKNEKNEQKKVRLKNIIDKRTVSRACGPRLFPLQTTWLYCSRTPTQLKIFHDRLRTRLLNDCRYCFFAGRIYLHISRRHIIKYIYHTVITNIRTVLADNTVVFRSNTFFRVFDRFNKSPRQYRKSRKVISRTEKVNKKTVVKTIRTRASESRNRIKRRGIDKFNAVEYLIFSPIILFVTIDDWIELSWICFFLIFLLHLLLRLV